MQLSGLKYDKYCQIYIHYFNKRYTEKITSFRGEVLTLQKPVQTFLKKDLEY